MLKPETLRFFLFFIIVSISLCVFKQIMIVLLAPSSFLPTRWALLTVSSLTSKPIFPAKWYKFSSTIFVFSSAKPVTLTFWRREYCSLSFAFKATFWMVSSKLLTFSLRTAISPFNSWTISNIYCSVNFIVQTFVLVPKRLLKTQWRPPSFHLLWLNAYLRYLRIHVRVFIEK